MFAFLLFATPTFAVPPAPASSPVSFRYNFAPDGSVLAWAVFFCHERGLTIDPASGLLLEDRRVTATTDELTAEAGFVLYETVLASVGATMVIEGTTARFEVRDPRPTETPLVVALRDVAAAKGDVTALAATLRSSEGGKVLIATHPPTQTLILAGNRAHVEALVQRLR